MRVRAKQLIGQLLVAETGTKNVVWDDARYDWTHLRELERAAKALGFTTVREQPDFAVYTTSEDLVINTAWGSLVVRFGAQIDKAKFDRELARLGAVAESCKKADGWDCDCYYWTPRWKLEKAAAALGFKSRYRYDPKLADEAHLVIYNFAGGICIYDGKQMDQAKFDRELARIDAMSESQGKKTWRDGSPSDYNKFSLAALAKACGNLGFDTRPTVWGNPLDFAEDDLWLVSDRHPLLVVKGQAMDRERFDRELARLSSVSESAKKVWSRAGSHADYWRVPAETIVEVAKNLGFEARLVPASATGHSPVNLMLASFNGPVIIANGRKMDREKFDRELAKLSAVAESATDYGFPKTGTWEVLPKTIRLYPNANALKVHAALKSMGITPIRPDPTKGTPRRIIELTYYSMGIPDDAVFDFARFARELARARSSSE